MKLILQFKRFGREIYLKLFGAYILLSLLSKEFDSPSLGMFNAKDMFD